jgi:hypothetical protein
MGVFDIYSATTVNEGIFSLGRLHRKIAYLHMITNDNLNRVV